MLSDNTFESRVKMMLPIARRLIEQDGIDPMAVDLSSSIAANEPTGLTERQVQQTEEWANAAYTLGLAVGLLLTPALLDGSDRSGQPFARRKATNT